MKEGAIASAQSNTDILGQLKESFCIHSENTAVETATETLSYHQLQTWVETLMQQWLPTLPSENASVAVLSDRPLDYIPAMLAAFQIGALYVPLDPKAPLQRQIQILEDVQPDVIALGTLETTPHVGDEYTQLVLPKFDPLRQRPPDLQDISGISQGKPAYLFYTSGSTGRPKGIVGKLSSLGHFADWEAKTFGIHNQSRISQFTTPTFDAFLRDVITPLSVGGTVCIPPQRPTLMGSDPLWEWIETSRVNLIHCVPSLFSALLDGQWEKRQLPDLKHILMAGEALPLGHAARWISNFGNRIQLTNLYGSTETTMVKLFHPITETDIRNGFISVGKPMSETEVVILNEAGELCEVDETGEIYIATEHRTLGYFKQPKVNETVFQENRFTRSKAYATGDLGALQEDGSIRLFGRKDRQVKIGGVRIEPEEIEQALLKSEFVHACAVTLSRGSKTLGNLIAKEAVQKATQSTEAGSSLIAYVVPTGKPTLTTLREHLAERIPTAAIPKKFIAVDSLPRNTNGKIDYQALSGIENGSEIRDQGYEAPKSETERVVSQIWESTLQVKRIGRTDHFFSLGGDSLKAMQVINRLREYSQGTLKITDLLKHPTLKDFCQTLESSQLKIPSEPKGHWSDFDTGSTIQFPLTPSQKGLWFLWKMDPDSPYYTCQGIIHLKGRFDSDALALAWDYISQRHDILRVRFGNVSGSPLQSFSNHSESWKNGHSLEGLAPHDAIQNIRDYAKQDAQIPFNLEGDSLLRGTFFKIDDGHHALQLTMHEITVDLWAIRILMNDLAACYQQALNGQVLFLEPKGPSFRQYLQWQTSKSQDHQLLQDEHHWKTELSGELPMLDLPLDHPRSASPSYHGKTVHTLLSEDLSSRLKTLSQQEGHTLYVTLLAGFFWMLNRYSG